MKKFFTVGIFAVLIAIMSIGCCACRKGKNNKSITGERWHLVRMMERDLQITAEQFLFSFGADGKFSGMAACNQLMGDYSITERGDMKFTNVASTRRMCREADLESQFTDILNRTTHYEIDGEMLMLLSNGEMQAVLKAVGR